MTSATRYHVSSHGSTPKSTGGDSCVGCTHMTPKDLSVADVEGVSRNSALLEENSGGRRLVTSTRQSIVSEGFAEVERREKDKA